MQINDRGEMMNVIIVAGPTCSGKSTFIKDHFPNHTVVDLFDFQKDLPCICVDTVLASYEHCRDALTAAIDRGEDVVLEHTLLKQKRRPMYIAAIREHTDAPIEMYFLMPSDEQLLKQMQERKYANDMRTVIAMKETAELPTLDEGYAVVHIISDDPEIAHVEREDCDAR